MNPSRRPSARQRALALVSLVAVGLLVLGVVGFLVRNPLSIAVGLLGVMLSIEGGWWLLRKRMPRRAFGLAGMLIGVGVLVAAMLAAAGSNELTLLRLGSTVVLLGVAILSGRAALAGGLREVATRRHRAAAPTHPVLLCNPCSGGGKVQRFGLVELASSLGIETVVLDRSLDLERLARDAIDRGADCLGMAGGDGSQALVASIATAQRSITGAVIVTVFNYTQPLANVSVPIINATGIVILLLLAIERRRAQTHKVLRGQH